ncbi:lysophospholipid acyltransferase family protein [Nocardioides cynanchi]|uniref:lysophospholipid acyltransferase family protein n=1 Tax=Nocardioides cynanchi TaxID=2558918 RepID=UPI0012456EFF|nr:lysophospholipid acyltransferase family protein [Nocardioides cynanchi]
MTTRRHPPTWLLHGGRPASRWIVRRRYDVRVHGGANVPTTGPVIVAANHTGVIDGPLLAIFSPRPVHALTKDEMFQGRLGRFLRLTGQIPLDRTHTDRRAVRACLHVLEHGGAVGIFPEGNRGAGDLTRFHNGAAYLALVSGAPIVPLMMYGTRPAGSGKDALPTPKAVLDLVYGAPFHVPPRPWPRTKRMVAATSTQLHERMRAELEAGLALTGQALPGPIPAASAKEMS